MRTKQYIQAFPDRKLSLWQSAVEEVAARHAARLGALAQPRPPAPEAGSEPVNGEMPLHEAMTVGANGLVEALFHGQPLPHAVPSADTKLAALAAWPAVSPTAAKSWRCSQLALQMAWARIKNDQNEIRRLETAAQFGSCDPLWAECVEQYLLYFKKDKGSIPYRSGGDYVLDDDLNPTAKIALLADWGTGSPPALDLLTQIRNLEPDLVLHLGDIYYSGTPWEVENRFLSLCRQTFAERPTRVYSLSGNHDMYSGGEGYYELVDQMQQQASYFCLRNQDWQFLAMDTGYNDADPFAVDSSVTHLTPTERNWHREKILSAGKRKTVLLSHHQLFTTYDQIGRRAVNASLLSDFAGLLDKVSIWFWGHEHNLALYGPYQGLERGRCIGCGAIPVFVDSQAYQRKFPDVPLLPDPRDPSQPVRLGNDGTTYNHAFALLELNGPKATVSYYQGGSAEPFYVESIPA
jgi:predicted phosphodiesterase